jgi:hypothetical protein
MELFLAGIINECAGPEKIKKNEHEGFISKESLGDHCEVLGHVSHFNLHSQLPANVIKRSIANFINGVGVIFLAVNNLAIEGCLADSLGPYNATSLQVVVILRFVHF